MHACIFVAASLLPWETLLPRISSSLCCNVIQVQFTWSEVLKSQCLISIGQSLSLNPLLLNEKHKSYFSLYFCTYVTLRGCGNLGIWWTCKESLLQTVTFNKLLIAFKNIASLTCIFNTVIEYKVHVSGNWSVRSKHLKSTYCACNWSCMHPKHHQSGKTSVVSVKSNK